MDDKNYIKEYCTGCGLCHSAYNVGLEVDEKGFPICKFDEQMNLDDLKGVCPVFFYNRNTSDGIWGKVDKAIVGYSSDADVRYRAASGGALTQIAIYLLERKLVDGIIHVTYDKSKPTTNIVVISRSADELKTRCGSRYSISVPLESIFQIVRAGEKYAFIGKPCDVMALRQYSSSHSEVADIFPYLLSFFCAGEPSVSAQENLLNAMGSSINGCKSITYRGNGWPGYTTVIDSDNNEFKMKYQDSWGKYLGRDLRNVCRFCLDGTGDAADIVCADFWYLNSNEEPDFSEHDGRNIIISRNKKSSQLLLDAIDAGYITVESDFTGKMDEFYKYQPHQYKRKGTMKSVISALRLCGKPTPRYNNSVLNDYASYLSRKVRIRYFLGTVKRVINKRI